MKTLIAGSRSITNYDTFKRLFLQSKYTPSEIISGGSSGVDKLGEKYAKEYGIPIKTFYISKQDWEKFGRAAGPIRNRKMGEYVKSVGGSAFILHDGVSRGTLNMKEICEELEIPLYYCVLKKNDVFTLPALMELEKKLQSVPMVSTELALNLIKQLSELKKEHQQVIKDVKIMYHAVDNCDCYDESGRNARALATPTAKLLQSLEAKQ